MDFPGGSDGQASVYNVGDPGFLWDISSPSGDWTWALAMKELSPNH